MKLKVLVLMFVLSVICMSCGRIGEIARIIPPPSPEEMLFESAEKKFRNEAYSEALNQYHQFLVRYPGTALIPAAMMKIGIIHSELKQYEKSRNAYIELIRKYPETDFARKAEVEIIFTYFQEGRFRQVIDNAEEISNERLSPDLRLRLILITGDSYMAMGAYPQAYLLFLDAFGTARETQRKEVGERLMASIALLDPAFIKEALKGLEGKPPTGYLMYQLGENAMAKGRIGEALTGFSDFVNRFPRHPNAPLARQRMQTLQSSAYFEGHRVGCLLPLSGQYETFGRRALQAVELALAEFGRRGGIDPPVELLVRDTGGDSEKARQAVEEFAEKRVAAIIGPIMTAPAAAEVAQKLGIPMIILTQKPGIVENGDFIFRNFMTPEMQMDALASYATGTLGLDRFAVLYPDEAYGETYLKLFREALLEKDGNLIAIEKYSPTDTDFSKPIKKLAARRISGKPSRDMNSPELQDDEAGTAPESGKREKTKPVFFDFDAIFIPDSPQNVGLIIPQLRFHDIDNVFLLGTNLWHSDVLIDYARSHLHQTIIPDGFCTESSNPDVKRFVEQFNAIFGRMPEFIEAVSYDTAMIIFDLIARPDIVNRGALKDALRDMPPYAGVTGKTSFSETGEAEKTLYLLKVNGNQFIEIQQ